MLPELLEQERPARQPFPAHLPRERVVSRRMSSQPSDCTATTRPCRSLAQFAQARAAAAQAGRRCGLCAVSLSAGGRGYSPAAAKLLTEPSQMGSPAEMGAAIRPENPVPGWRQRLVYSRCRSHTTDMVVRSGCSAETRRGAADRGTCPFKSSSHFSHLDGGCSRTRTCDPLIRVSCSGLNYCPLDG
jgi:hypothetical protein